jgi:nicotinamidase-related amidase
MDIRTSDTAVVFVDPQNDVLSKRGANWGAVGESVTANNTVAHMEEILRTAKAAGFDVFISPHYGDPTDADWNPAGARRPDESRLHPFAGRGALTLEGLTGPGADWLERFKSYIEDGQTIVVNPHKIWGPQTNDLVLQLRRRSISKVILGGMLANLCVESHLRELLEQGFEVAAITDATAGPRHPELGDGYAAAMINYRYLAHSVLSTREIVSIMQASSDPDW